MFIRLLGTTAMVLALTAPAVASPTADGLWSKPDPRQLQIAQDTEQDSEAVEAQDTSQNPDPDTETPIMAADDSPDISTAGDEAAQEKVEIPADATVITEQGGDQWRTDSLVGMSVTNPAGEDIGDVNDLLIAEDGSIEGVVLSVGGFLGIGDKLVALGWDEVEVVEDQDVVVVDLTKDQLEAAPDFRTKEQIAEQMEIEQMQQQAEQPLGSQTLPLAPEEESASEEGSSTMAADDSPDASEADEEAAQEKAEVPVDTTVIAEQDTDQWRADSLFGMSVTNPAGEDIGDVTDLLIAQDGSIEGVVLSVGGFLGIGDKLVALGWDEVEVVEDQDVVVVDLTKGQLEAAPDFRTKEQIAEQMEIERLRQQPEPPLGSQTVPLAPEERGAEQN